MGKRIPEEERLQVFEFLRQRYPEAFRLPGDIKPLEVGIGGKLMQELKDLLPTVGIRREAVYAVLQYYTCTPEYKKARKKLGNLRINLQGETTGEVTEEHLELGRKANAATRAAKAKRKALEREMEAKRLEKERQLEAAAAKKAAKEAAKKAEQKPVVAKKVVVKKTIPKKAPEVTKQQKAIKEMSLRKPKIKQGTTQAKVVVKPTITIKSKKVLSLKKDKE